MSSITESTNTIKIFLSYVHEDVAMRDRLEKQLSILRRQGLNLIWHDREIHTGREWVHEIDAELNTTQIILLLVSPDFMDSDYCFGVEVRQALERHETGEAYVIPIILRPVYWDNAPFSKLHALPTGGQPVTRWPDRDEAFFDIAMGIQNVIKELLASYKNAEGDVQYRDERYEEALTAYHQAIQLNSHFALAYNGKGNALFELSRYEEALDAYEQVIQLYPENARVYYNKGVALYHLRRYEEAVSVYEQAIILDPKNASAYNSKGTVLCHLKRYEEALDAFEQAIILDSNEALYYNNKGSAFRTLRLYEEALSSYRQAILLDPDDALAFYNMGTTLYHLKRYWDAIDAYNQAISLDPNYALAHNSKGNALLSLRYFRAALYAYERAIELDPKNALAYYNKGTTLHALRQYKPALYAYERAIELDPKNALAYYNKGTIHYYLKQHKKAQDACEQAISLDPNYAPAHNGRGNALRARRRYEAALAAYERAIQLNPRFDLAYNGKGNALYDLKRYEEALAVFKQAISLDSTYAPYYNDKGNALRSLGRYEEALVAYKQAIQLNPQFDLAYYGKGNALYNLKRHVEALVTYEQAIQLNPKNVSAYNDKGTILRSLRRYEEALIACEQAILLNPRNALAYSSKALILYDLEQYEEALVAYEQAIFLNPNLRGIETLEGLQNLRIRVESVQHFLMKIGFENKSVSKQTDFLAIPIAPIWRERFPRGLYVKIMFNISVDQNIVQSIHHTVKMYSDHALVIIERQPAISGWMAIGGLRIEEKDRFVFLPIEETFIKESIVENKEAQMFSFYINKQLGQDFDPYDERDPVSDAVNFFGRESLTDEILYALRLGQRLGLFGLHKMGKSSVLQRLKKKSEFPVTYVYLTTGDSLSGIYKRILEGWSIDIRIKYPHLQWPIPRFTKNTDTKLVFDSAVKDLLVRLGKVSDTPMLGIFLDEIENIIPYREGDETTLRLYVNLMNTLRGLQQETNSLSLLVAGVHPNLTRRNYFWGDQKNPMYQVIVERFLLPLDKEDCAYMIRSLGQQINVTYDDDALGHIVQMSGSHPFLARQLCSYAYRNREEMNHISIQSIQKVVKDFIKDPATASYFDDHGLWGELGKEDIWGEGMSYVNHEILCLLAASTVDLSESELGSSLNKKQVERALSALKERGIIGSSNGSRAYHITFGIFRDWIRLHKIGME